MNWIERFKPGLPRIWLQLAAGLVWSCVGVFLISLALEWIWQPGVVSRWKYLVPGGILAFLIFRFGFSRLAMKNSDRIQELPVDKPCLFAFQEWHSYPLVLFMVGLGITLREFTPISKPLLGVLYIGIGGGLGGASLLYYRWIIRRLRENNRLA